MAIDEWRLEDLMFRFAEDFFAPEFHFHPYARQLTLPSGKRLDMVLRDTASGHLWVFEVKKGRLALSTAKQLAGYMQEAKSLGGHPCRSIFHEGPLAAVVAPEIPQQAKTELQGAGVRVFEISEDAFRQVAQARAVDLAFDAPYGTRNKFWAAFDAYLRAAGSPITLAINKCNAGDDCNAADFRFGRPFWITFRCSTRRNGIDVDFTFGAQASGSYRRLCESDRIEFDRELSGVVLWHQQPSESHIKVQRFLNVCDSGQWSSLFPWMREQGEIMFRWSKKI